MYTLLVKYLVTAGLIVLVSEIARRSEKFGALVTALPLVAVLTLIWLYVEKQPADKIASYSTYTFWYVLPTLPMFLLFPPLLARAGFWPALLGVLLLTGLNVALVAMALRRFGINLL